jgi:transposase
VRVIWSYVEGLDLSALEDRIKARDDSPGHPAISPRLLVAVWLYATSAGVGSARVLEQLCASHDAYRWLRGNVSVNHHTLSDFRVECADLLDRLLAEHVAALAKAGVINLDSLAQDGVRVRASAGAASFRRAATLDQHLAQAQQLVATLKREVEANSDASNRRMAAARERAARERKERLEAAQQALAEIKKQREQAHHNGKAKKEPRASTTDPAARVMKMADGGFRPAYNVQVASTAGEQFVVGVEITNAGSDRGLLQPMLQNLQARIGRHPARHLADGGFNSAQDIEWAHRQGIEIYCPPVQSRHGTDPYSPRRDDGDGVLAWRARMASEAGKQQYKTRSICECIHARWRNWDLRLLTVRGIPKVRAVVLWYALANNILQAHRLATA